MQVVHAEVSHLDQLLHLLVLALVSWLVLHHFPYPLVWQLAWWWHRCLCLFVLGLLSCAVLCQYSSLI